MSAYLCGCVCWCTRGSNWTKGFSIREISRVPPWSLLISQVGVASGSDSISIFQHKILNDREGLIDCCNAK